VDENGVHSANSRYLALVDALLFLKPEQPNVWLKNPAKYSAEII